MFIRKVFAFTCVTTLLAISCSGPAGYEYPESKSVEHVETLHGVKISDPYRWLEDLDSEETKQWVQVQSEFAFDYLEKLPERVPLRERLTELWNYEKYGVPRKEGERLNVYGAEYVIASHIHWSPVGHSRKNMMRYYVNRHPEYVLRAGGLECLWVYKDKEQAHHRKTISGFLERLLEEK